LKRLEGEELTGLSGRFLLVSDVDFGEVPNSPQEREGNPRNSGMVFRQLPGTALEAEVMRPLVPNLPGSLELFELRQREATVRRVCKEMSSARIAHIATHGVFSNPSNVAPSVTLGSNQAMSPNGMRIGTEARNPLVNVAVVLAGANLPVHDRSEESFLSGEALAALDLRRCRLCVLPDCHTAKGEVARGAGVFGLQRALHQAGVGDVVACLWGVSDDVTPLLMKMFYEKLAVGSAPMDALRACQLHAMRNPANTSAGGTRSDDADFEAHEESNAMSPTSRAPDAMTATRDWAGFVISGIGE
jgi:CHAT domain-containing protein